MKKKWQVIPALALCVSMLFSTSVSATSTVADKTAAGTTEVTVTGNATLTSPIYKVALPTTIVFSLDPYGLTNGKEVVAAEHVMVNRSNVPVKVDAKFTVNAAKAVNLMTYATFDTKDYAIGGDDATTAKEGWFGIAALDTIGGTDYATTTKTTPSALLGVYTDLTGTIDDNEGYISVIDNSAGTAAKDDATPLEWSFLLTKADYTDKTINGLASSDMGIAAFSFAGGLNPYAAWAASDIKVTMKYTFTAVTADDFTALEGDLGQHTLLK